MRGEGRAKIRDSSKGFTLIEILIVVGILGIVSAIAVPVYFKTIERSQLSAFSGDARAVYEAFMHFYADHSRFPSESEFDRRTLEPLVSRGYLHDGAARAFADKQLTGSIQFYMAPNVGSPDSQLILVMRPEFDRNQLAYILYTQLAAGSAWHDGVYYWQDGRFVAPDEVKP